jgi:lantibiotic modifying enzyme
MLTDLPWKLNDNIPFRFQLAKTMNSTYYKHRSSAEELKSLQISPAKEAVAFSGMDSVIFLYHKAKSSGRRKWRRMADKALDNILSHVDPSTPVCMEDGLCGLGCGFMYLLRNGFVRGDEDVILEDVDMAVRSAVSDCNEDAGWSSGLCGIFAYLVMRLENSRRCRLFRA